MIENRMFNIGVIVSAGSNHYASLGFEPVELQPYKSAKPGFEGVVVDSLGRFHNLSGTYLESAGHIVKGGPGLEALDFNRLREVLVIKLPPKHEGDTISQDELNQAMAEARKAAGIDLAVQKIGSELGYGLLFATGYTDYWLEKSPGGVISSADYNGRGPYFDKGALQPVLDQEFRFLMGDIPSISHPEDTKVLNQFYQVNLDRGVIDVCICFPLRNTPLMQPGYAVIGINPVPKFSVAVLCNPVMYQGKELTETVLAAEKAARALPH